MRTLNELFPRKQSRHEMLKFTRWMMLLTVGLLAGCGDSDDIDTSGIDVDVFLEGRANIEFEKLFDRLEEENNIENAILLVDVPKHGYRMHKSMGIGNTRTNTPLRPDQNFRTGSVTKLLTAIRVLQLVEQNKLSLDQPIGEILSDTDMPSGESVSGLSVYHGQAIGAQITVRQLLSHRSGIHDYLFGEGSGMTLAEKIVLDATSVLPSGISKQQWTPATLLAYFFQNNMGNMPYGAPNTEFFYTDSNYLLLGLIIEKVTGMSLAENYRTGIYSPAGMIGSYLEWYEPAQSEPPADHYLDASRDGLGNLNIVDLGINTSTDWGGGGVVTNADMLRHLLTALYSGKLFTHSDSLQSMMSFLPTTFPTTDYLTQYNYGLGLTERVYQLDKFRKVKFYGHDGFWGIYAYYEPKTKTSIALMLNQAITDDHWIGDVVRVLDKAKLFGL
ncbi:serine hydrolase domain-containing protein [Grimontia marina]|uniref:D-alanyl-D-alanine carboxypeptidase n=1 Tax=Grimontia marina TaxID=646534 RepID=A0A128FH92_9GAMM|nr:serine hydrolase domain-containing protein [Grimontia marina]CZF86172.1 D-alanyl-D-alanine carboxypeptidase precursor [Grimontia marina]